ncbi:MAG: hypothetical protein FJX52_07135, partial [Alphaproteobacteria bacterium]|nr:hypothetical protein [Alphaproteobacteria bacterium]
MTAFGSGVRPNIQGIPWVNHGPWGTWIGRRRRHPKGLAMTARSRTLRPSTEDSMNDMTIRNWPVSARARALHESALVWDAHSCLPLRPGADIGHLERHRAAGIDYVSVNVGMDFNPLAQCTRVIATYRAWITARPDQYALAGTVGEVRRAKATGKLAVSFDLEGSDMLGGDLDMLRLYRDLGVRQMHLAYNRDNAVGGGCHGADIPLSNFGHQV